MTTRDPSPDPASPELVLSATDPPHDRHMTIFTFHKDKHEFARDIQGKAPYVFKACFDPSCISWQDFNEIIQRCRIESDEFKIAHGNIVPKQHYVERYLEVGVWRHRLIKAAVYEYLRNGATLIANKIYNEPRIDPFSRAIAHYTGRQVVTSAYLAFGSQDSYRNHWDTRDVFAVQLKGRKRWVVYEPTFQDPLYTQQSKDFTDSHPAPQGDPFMEIILEPGDVFYLPRGWWHNPSPLGEETLHLAIGTFPALAINYVATLLDRLQAFPPARASLSDRRQDAATLQAIADHLSQLILDEASYESYLEQWAGHQRLESNLALEIFGRPDTGMPSGSRLRLCSHSHFHDNQGFVIANGIKVRLNGCAARLIGHIHRYPGCRMEDALQTLMPDERARARTLIFDLCNQDVLEWIPATHQPE